jgi:hypothetical protein
VTEPTEPLDVRQIFHGLGDAAVDYVLIGGLAVNAHGVIRSTKDVDICPSPARENLERLATLLRRWKVQQLGVGEGDFEAAELPFDPTSAADLAEGGNFRLTTPYGVLDLMQWVPGIDSDHAYTQLAHTAVTAHAFDLEIRVCSLADLRVMKAVAGRPQDLQDLRDLAAAHPEAAT